MSLFSHEALDIKALDGCMTPQSGTFVLRTTFFLWIVTIFYFFRGYKVCLVRPWLKLDGELNGVLLKRFQETMLIYIMQFPGVTQVHIAGFDPFGNYLSKVSKITLNNVRLDIVLMLLY